MLESANGFPSGAMHWHNNFRSHLFQALDRFIMNLFKHRAGEMKSAQNRINVLYPGNFLCIQGRINNTGMRAAGDDHQPLAGKINYKRLVVGNRILPYFAVYFHQSIGHLFG